MPFPWPERTAIKDHVGIYELELFPLIVDEEVYGPDGDNLPISSSLTGKKEGWVLSGVQFGEFEDIAEGFSVGGIQIGDNLPNADFIYKDYGTIGGTHDAENRLALFDGYAWIVCPYGQNVDTNGDLQIQWARDPYGSNGFFGGATDEGLPTFSLEIFQIGAIAVDNVINKQIIPYPESNAEPDARALYCFQPDITDSNPPVDKRVVAIELPAAELVNVLAGDDPDHWHFGSVTETIQDITDNGYAWTFTKLDETEPEAESPNVICKWAPTPLFTSPPVSGSFAGTLGAADCTIYTPVIAGLPTGFALMADLGEGIEPRTPTATVDGWMIFPYDTSLITKDHMLWVDTQWANWREIDLVTNDETVNEYLLNSPKAPHIQVDQFGAWIFYWEEFTVGLTTYEQFWAYAPGDPLDAGGDDGPGEGGDGSENEPNDPEIDLDGTGAVQVVAWGFSLDGHDFYVIRLGNSTTLVYDLSTGQWSEWASPQSGNWRPFIGTNWLGMGVESMFENPAQAVTKVVAGDDTLGVIWTVDPTIGYDEDPDTQDATPFARVVIGGVPMRMRETQKVGAVYLSLNLGQPQLDGASVTLETSDDFGNNWTDHGTFTVDADNFTQELSWRSLGLIRNPGRIFRITDGGGTVRIDGLDIR